MKLNVLEMKPSEILNSPRFAGLSFYGFNSMKFLGILLQCIGQEHYTMALAKSTMVIKAHYVL